MTYIERIATAIQHLQAGVMNVDDRDALDLYSYAAATGRGSKGEQRELDAKLAELGIK